MHDAQYTTALSSEVYKMNDYIKSPKWVPCPICGGKTRIKVFEDTVIVKFPLFRPKCKKETLVDIVNLKMVVKNELNTKNVEPTLPPLW